MNRKDAPDQSNCFNKLINISEDGYWIDPQGKRWRLVPTMCSADQMGVAVGRAQQWTDQRLNQMLRLEYALGYEAMLRLAPHPPLEKTNLTKTT